MKNIIILILIVLNLYSEDTITAKKQNVLSVQSLIEFEEKIAVNFEKYLLTKFVIPTINQLQTDDYLGSNFSLVNKFGDIIAFDSSSKKE